MPKSSLWLAGLCGILLSHVVRADNKFATPSSQIKDWKPDTPLRLQNEGKQSKLESELSAHKSSAQSLYREKRYEEAAREYQKCADLDPRDSESILGVGYSFYNLRRYEEAFVALEKARLLRPDGYDANFWSGVSLIRLGRFKEAITPLEKAHAARPDDKVTRRELFFCYAISGRPQSGFKLYPKLFASIG